MLTLTRAPGRAIRIGEQVIVKVLEVKGSRIRLGIDAPKEVSIFRGEDAEPQTKVEAAIRSVTSTGGSDER